MSEPETPNAKRATPLHFDSDRVFAKQPFSDDEAVEIITDAAVEALAAHFDRPLPQSNIGEAIAIVRVHVDYLRGVGIVDAALARRPLWTPTRPSSTHSLTQTHPASRHTTRSRHRIPSP